MFTNWQTSLGGLGAIALGGASLFGVHIPGVDPMSGTAALTAIMTGISLLRAKDSNVTGGTKPNA